MDGSDTHAGCGVHRASAARLRQIAALLGVPSSAFHQPRADDKLCELLTLWDALAGDADRAMILGTMRGLLDRRAATDGGASTIP